VKIYSIIYKTVSISGSVHLWRALQTSYIGLLEVSLCMTFVVRARDGLNHLYLCMTYCSAARDGLNHSQRHNMVHQKLSL